MGDIKLDARLFQRRMKTIMNAWKRPDDFSNADCILLAVGSIDDDITYSKSTSLQTWLLGYEFPNTIICITPEKVVFVASSKQGSYLETLKTEDARYPIEVLTRTKDAQENALLFSKFLDIVSKSKNGKQLGVVVKDKTKGKFINEWAAARESYETKFEDVDISNGISAILAIKDDDELKNVKMAARATSQVMKNFFIKEFEAILDDDRTITHETFTEVIEKSLEENNRSKLKLPSDMTFDLLDFCYPPIVQSGGKFDLKPSAMSNEDELHAGVVICCIGLKYKGYCVNLGRTFLIDPEKSSGKEKNYRFLLELQEHIFTSLIKDGVTCKDIYNKAVSYVEKKRPDLKEYFVKNIGFGIGLEFRDSNYVLSGKNSREIKSGMVLNVSIGFQGLEAAGVTDEKSKTYALLLMDTVRVTPEGCSVITEATKEVTDISYEFKEPDGDEENADDSSVRKEATSSAPPVKKTAVISSKLRAEEKDEMSAEQRRRIHQKALAEQKHQEGLARYADKGSQSKSDEKQVFKRFDSYKKETQLPNETRDLKVLVDKRNLSVILPIYGYAVPFHISTLKNVVKNEDRDYVYLRFNFITPGQSFGKKDQSSPFEDPEATFVRTITFKSTDVHRFSELAKEINDLKKEIQMREAEKKEMSDLVAQDKLVELRGRRPIRLPDIFVRPAMEGKKFPGEVEIHTNGIRYVNQIRNEQRIDILFSNIKHMFFQSCNSELVVIVHIHLKNPIMIGKKKTKDIQFYREVVDASYDETGNRKRRYNYGDEDELAAEQEERRRRSALNKEFKEFAMKVSEASKGLVDMDVPFRDLSFNGVPHRQLVLMQPTTDCLVHLTDPPFMVISLVDIEVAHLERVQFGLKNFDMVLVFKELSRPVVHINTIPVNQLDNVKEWLDSVDVAYTEGPVNLNWTQIMKTVNEDPAAFFAEGGWSFLRTDTDDENSDAEESASEFEVESEEFDEASEESESSFDSGASGSDFSGSGSEDESGEDWDEMEKKAARDDERKKHGGDKRRDDSDDDDRHKKKKVRK